MNDLMVQHAPTSAALAVFGPAIQAALQGQAAYRAWLNTFRFAPRMVMPRSGLAATLALGEELKEDEIAEAIATELGIAYGCDVTHMQPLRAVYPCVAVAFEAVALQPALPAARVDPVDLLPLAPVTELQYDALIELRVMVGRMLSAETRRDRVALAECVRGLQRLEPRIAEFPGRIGLLYAKVLAANIQLCVRGAQ